PKTRKAAEELRATTRHVAALSASSNPAREQLQRLTREQERLQAELSEFSDEARAAFEEKPLAPQAVSAALPQGRGLVDCLLYWRYGTTYGDGRRNRGGHRVAFVSRRGRPTVRIGLGPADRALDAVHKWRKLLVRGQSGKPFGAEVKKLVWSPLEKY